MWAITYGETNLVSRHRGALPVILSCPHDGDEILSGVPERTGEGIPPTCPPFRKASDLHTREITEGVAQRLVDVFGEAPYVVIAAFDRKFIDANRPAECAFEVPAAQPYYDEYHNTLRDFVDEIRYPHLSRVSEHHPLAWQCHPDCYWANATRSRDQRLDISGWRPIP
jgi:hypothetical protein